MDPNIANNPPSPAPVNFNYPTVGNDGSESQEEAMKPVSPAQDQSQLGQLTQTALPQTTPYNPGSDQGATNPPQTSVETDKGIDQSQEVNIGTSQGSNTQSVGLVDDPNTDNTQEKSVESDTKEGVSALQSLAQKLSSLKNEFVVETDVSQNADPSSPPPIENSNSDQVSTSNPSPDSNPNKLGVPSIGVDPLEMPSPSAQNANEEKTSPQSAENDTQVNSDSSMKTTFTPPTTPTPPANSPVAVSTGFGLPANNSDGMVNTQVPSVGEAKSVSSSPQSAAPTPDIQSTSTLESPTSDLNSVASIDDLGPMPVNVPIDGIPGSVGSGKSLEDLLKEVEPEDVISPETPLVSSGRYSIQQLLDLVIERDASDLHITVGYPVMVRIDGKMQKINEDIVTVEMANELILPVLPEQKKELLEVNREVDLAYSHEESARFRINAYYQQESLAAAFRLIPNKIRSLDELKMPPVYHQLAKLKQGLVLVTGPTGSGKSTTLASILQEINMTRHDHIITIEDPVEYVFPKAVAMVDQREMHEDTHSWEIALKSALRQDPDVLLVGEMRDYETISAAITLAETGHLVFATLHTNSASQTIDRIIDVFPEHQQSQIRSQLSHVIEAVVAQRLIPLTSGGRIAVSEIMIANPAVKNLIREAKTHQLDNVIRTSADIGMVSLEHSLVKLVRENLITMDMAQEYAVHPEEVVRLLKS